MFNHWITIERILFILLIVTVNSCLSQIERDIVLTPNLSLHRNGKILYYEPKKLLNNFNHKNNNNSTKVPWEQTLKHVTYLTLHDRIDEKSQNISNLSDYQNFLNSTYIQSSNEYIPKFGDIITLARGRLEKLPNNQYFFIEGQSIECNIKTQCNDYQSKLIAYWNVQKIRHRDPEKKFRYELKIAIKPNIGDKNESSNKRETTHKYEAKAFILKEDDYPENFANIERHISQRRSDDDDFNYDSNIKSNKFNEVSIRPQYFRNTITNIDRNNKRMNYLFPELNTGEYLPNHSVPTNSRIGKYSSKFLFPTTFHPNKYNGFKALNQISSSNYKMKFPEESEENLKNIDTSVPTAHHLHHHYYVTRSNFPEISAENNYGTPFVKDTSVLKNSGQQLDVHQYHTSTPIANQIPVPLDITSHNSYKISATRPILPSPPSVFYMQPIPMYPVYPLQEHVVSRNPFIESSPKPLIENPEVQTVRYSDPDPLYHPNYDINNNNHLINVKDENLSDEQIPNRLLDHTIAQTYEDDSEGSESKGKNHNSGKITTQLPAPNSIVQHSISSTESQSQISHSTQTSATSAFLNPPRTSTEPSTTPIIIEATIKEPTTENLSQLINLKEYELSSSVKVTTTTTQTPTIKRKYRSTTERPVLKWKPKRPNKWSKIITESSTKGTIVRHPLRPTNDLSNKFEFEKIPINATEKLITMTPPTNDVIDDKNNQEIATKQSVSTSISIKIGTETEERPFMPTISLPNVELFKANLENVKTNSTKIKLYKASSDMLRIPNKSETKEEHEIAKSIVQHVQNLT